MDYNYLGFLLISIASYFAILLIGIYSFFWLSMIVDSIDYTRKFSTKKRWGWRLFVIFIPLIGSLSFLILKQH